MSESIQTTSLHDDRIVQQWQRWRLERIAGNGPIATDADDVALY
jgi:hypothetical protein